MSPLVTLTTDFGTRDAYVAAMKAVVLGLAPEARLVDVTHEVDPQDVMQAAFVLGEAAWYFPPGTVHLVVVDPGVGTARRAVAVEARGHRFVGPDNGLFPLLLGGEAPAQAVALDRPEVWRGPTPSRTFHGRDIFAPVAGHLARGARLDEVGTAIAQLEPLRWALPIADEQGVQGYVVHIDHFGNCITNLDRATVEARRQGRSVKCYAGASVLREIRPTYAAVAPGEPLLLYGSSDRLEIAVCGGNAADLLGIRKGASVTLVFAEPRAPEASAE